MTAIASYYASVGVGIDKNSLNNVQKYLESIQKKMESFQSKMSKSSNLSIRIDNVSISQTALRNAIKVASSNQRIRLDKVSVGSISVNNAQISKAVRIALQTNTTGGAKQYKVNLGSFDVSTQKLVSALNRSLRTTTSNQNTSIRLNNFSVSQKALVDAINKAVNREGPYSRIRIGALLSQSSLTAMRQQIRQAINQLVVNPTINPRISQARVREARRVVSGESRGASYSRDRLKTRDPRSMNPWYNPMMIGGATGAFLRYGMFSLPFVAGAYGLNSLSQNMTRLEGQNIMLTTSAQGAGAAAEQYQKVDEIGRRLGLRTSDMLPFYAQMFAGARGTNLEQTLPTNFQNFMDYAMAMGVNDQQLEGGIRAISQAIAKGAIYSEEWRQQLAEQGFPEAMNILADVAAGGDRDKLRKMMEQGEVDVYKYLPLVLDEMGRRAQAGIGKYFESVLYQQRRVSRANEDFLRAFMDAGAAEGMLAIYKAFAQTVEDSLPAAQTLGDLFYRAGHIIATAIVLPRELYDWLNGKERDGNFMTALFGSSDESTMVTAITRFVETIKSLFSEVSTSSHLHFGSVNDDISDIIDVISFLIRRMADLVEIAQGYSTGGIEGGGYAIRKAIAKSDIRSQVDIEADDEELKTGKRVSERERSRRAREREIEWIEKNPFNPSDTFLSRRINPIDFLNPMETFRILRGSKQEGNESGGSWINSFTPFLTTNGVKEILGIRDSEPESQGRTSWFSGNPDNLPQNTPATNIGPQVTQIYHNLSVSISGKVVVEGEVETFVPDISFDSFSQLLNDAISGAIPQSAAVAR